MLSRWASSNRRCTQPRRVRNFDELHPIGRMGEISDVVDAILYLESAGSVTGEILRRWPERGPLRPTRGGLGRATSALVTHNQVRDFTRENRHFRRGVIAQCIHAMHRRLVDTQGDRVHPNSSLLHIRSRAIWSPHSGRPWSTTHRRDFLLNAYEKPLWWSLRVGGTLSIGPCGNWRKRIWNRPRPQRKRASAELQVFEPLSS